MRQALFVLSTPARGGSAALVKNLARAVILAGHEAAVMAPGTRGLPADGFYAPVPHLALWHTAELPLPPPPRYEAGVANETSMHDLTLLDWQRMTDAWAEQFEVFRDHFPDPVVHVSHLGPHTVAARRVFANRRMLVHLHGTELAFLEEAAAEGHQLAEPIRAAAASADVILVNAPSQLELAARLLGPDAARRLQVLAPVVDDSTFNPHPTEADTRADLATPFRRSGRAPVRVLFVARALPVKRVGLLLKAFHDGQLAGRASLILAGAQSGESVRDRWFTAELLAQAAEQYGWQPQRNVAAVMRSADVLCMPSYRESFGMVAAEAMLTGIPVVASAGCGIADYFPDVAGERPGWTVGVDDLEDLIRTLITVVEGHEERQARGTVAAAFSLSTFALSTSRQRMHFLLEDNAD